MQPGQIFMVTLPQSVPMATPAPVLPTATFTPSPAASFAAGVGAGIAAAAAGLANMHVGAGTDKKEKTKILWACNHAGEIFTATVPGGGKGHVDWRKSEGACVQMDVSKKWIYTVNRSDGIYRKHVDGSGTWERCNGEKKHIVVTDNGYVWGRNKHEQIWTARADEPAQRINWHHIPGACRDLAASKKWVYTVNSKEEIYRTRTDSRPRDTGGWERCKGNLVSLSITNSGFLWGVGGSGEIWFAEADAPAMSLSWRRVEGQASQISASGAWVYHVGTGGTVWRKKANNKGPTWEQVPVPGGVPFKHIAVYHGAAHGKKPAPHHAPAHAPAAKHHFAGGIVPGTTVALISHTKKYARVEGANSLNARGGGGDWCW